MQSKKSSKEEDRAITFISMDEVNLDDSRGVAVALGHLLGCSGTCILTTLVHEMKLRKDVPVGFATMYIGVG